MQPKQNMLMLGKDDNELNNFGSYKDEKSISKMQNMEKNHRDLIGKNLDIGSHAKNS